jgi:hypothetical protein
MEIVGEAKDEHDVVADQANRVALACPQGRHQPAGPPNDRAPDRLALLPIVTPGNALSATVRVPVK